MAATFKLPQIDYATVVVVNTPIAADVALAGGLLTLKDEAGTNALQVRFSDILKAKKYGYVAGTAHKLSIALASVTLTANRLYSLQITLPNRQDFFLYGKETNPLVTLRTYTWASGTAAPTAAQIVAGFVAVINADTEAGVTASINGTTTTLDLLADSADAGAIQALFSDSAATYTNTIPYVAPIGTISEVELQAPGKSLAGTTYNRYVIRHRRLIKHNAVSGLSVFKNVDSVVYEASNFATSAAYETVIDNVLSGTISVATLAAVGTEVQKYFAITSL